jgi:DNA-binding response OmpR family regulator
MLLRVATEQGYRVLQAFDGEEALRLVTADRPDLLLLDIMMPRLDGRDVLRRLKGDPATARLPVIVFSARGDHSDRLVGLELGADDYIEKPFDIDALLRRIEYLIWKSREA